MKQKLQQLFDKSNIKQTLLNTVFILFIVASLFRFVRQIFITYYFESYAISENLINYQGGFVRRGLLGEILFFFTKNFNINIEWTIKIISLICLLIVCIFFVRNFLKKGYTLYILPLCFFLQTMLIWGYFTRKDSLMLCILIAVLWIFNKTKNSILKFFAINLLMIFMLLTHEAFAFFSLPILFLLFFSNYQSKGILQSIILSLIFLLPSISAFLLTLHYHGDIQIAQTIWDSWVAVANLKPAELTTHSHGGISAIAWDKEWTFRFHFNTNFWSESFRVLSVFFWIIVIPTVYYIVTNALLVFRKNEMVFTNKDKTILSSVLIFQFVCLLPLFLTLSCDLGRIIFYWVASSFIVFLLIPKEKIEKSFPTFFTKFVERINRGLTHILHPTKTTIVLLIMFIGIPIYGFSFEGVIRSSVAGNILLLFSETLITLKSFL